MLLVCWTPSSEYCWFVKVLLIVGVILKMSADSSLKALLCMLEELVLSNTCIVSYFMLWQLICEGCICARNIIT